MAAPLQAIADKHGQGWRVPRSDVQPLVRSNERAARIPRSCVHATDKPKGWFFGLGDLVDTFATKVRADGWDLHAIASDHLPQLNQPKALAAILGSL